MLIDVVDAGDVEFRVVADVRVLLFSMFSGDVRPRGPDVVRDALSRTCVREDCPM
jgi:hypothetical protein